MSDKAAEREPWSDVRLPGDHFVGLAVRTDEVAELASKTQELVSATVTELMGKSKAQAFDPAGRLAGTEPPDAIVMVRIGIAIDRIRRYMEAIEAEILRL